MGAKHGIFNYNVSIQCKKRCFYAGFDTKKLLILFFERLKIETKNVI